ncbi:flap endonuclease-1 [Candidatus Micrarchaeota archaeon]|nr:flap endonuclease-1 [Candidatus Micrarchaeota archaeon]
MGVDLGDLAVKETISLQSLSGKKVAIDSFNMLYQFLASIRQEDGTPLMDYSGNITAHLSGLFYRTCRFMEHGLRPVFVFDGEAPEFKEKTLEERAEAKKTAKKKWKEALEEEKLEEARKYAQGTSRLTSEMVEESKELVEALGLPVVQAPQDGEAQAAMMVRQGLADATASQDYDALMFGSPYLLRNLSITGRRKVPRQNRYVMVEPEIISLEETLQTLEIGRAGLIFIGLLDGTDFNEGIKGVGPKTGLKIAKEVETLDELIDYVKEKYDYQFEVDIEAVFNLFLDPPYTPVDKLEWKDVDREAVTELLVEKHDFSEDRVESSLDDVIEQTRERNSQKSLDEWF